MSSIEQDPAAEPVRAVVTRVRENYVVTYPLRDCGDLTTRDSVTFSLEGWRGTAEPQCEQIVELSGTTLWSRGWRADSARPVVARRKNQQNEQRRSAS